MLIELESDSYWQKGTANFLNATKKKKKNPIFIRIEHIDVKDLRFTDQNFRERKYLKSFRERERERERESFVFIWTLCLSSEIFYVGEIERERDLVP